MKKSSEFYKAVLALDPRGQTGTAKLEYEKVEVTYTEYAEYALATEGLSGSSDKPDPAPVHAFLRKYPETKLAKEANRQLGYFYSNRATKAEAAAFFPEYAARFPNDPDILNSWLSRIIRDKEPLEKGAELAIKLKNMTESNPVPAYHETMAQFYALKGDKAGMEEIYGKDFMNDRVSGLAYDLLDYANFWVARDGHAESAMAMAELALKMKPDQAYMAQQAAAVFVKAGQDSKALDIFGPAWLQKNSDNPIMLSNYATFWAGQGKNLDDALAAARKLAERQPGKSYAWRTLATVLAKMKSYDEALAAAQKALDLADNERSKEFLRKSMERIKEAKEKDKK